MIDGFAIASFASLEALQVGSDGTSDLWGASQGQREGYGAWSGCSCGGNAGTLNQSNRLLWPGLCPALGWEEVELVTRDQRGYPAWEPLRYPGHP